MSPLRFRAWFTAKKKMTSGFDVFNMTTDMQFSVFSGEAIPMQSTGLNDKNGEEIFEGDVAEVSVSEDQEHPNRYVVTYLMEDSRFVFRSKTGNINLSVGLFHNDASVICNIYQNPGLLPSNA